MSAVVRTSRNHSEETAQRGLPISPVLDPLADLLLSSLLMEPAISFANVSIGQSIIRQVRHQILMYAHVLHAMFEMCQWKLSPVAWQGA